LTTPLWETLASSSFLERAFLRWVLAPAVRSEIASCVIPQRELGADGHTYFIDYEFEGESMTIAVELDGFEFHGNRYAFSCDRMRQNDLARTGRVMLRFSYDSVRLDTARCVAQLQDVLRADGRLQEFVVPDPIVERPEMDPDPNLLSNKITDSQALGGPRRDAKLFRHRARQARSQDTPGVSEGGFRRIGELLRGRWQGRSLCDVCGRR
jgi:Protein of unknown function (DUF559)